MKINMRKNRTKFKGVWKCWFDFVTQVSLLFIHYNFAYLHGFIVSGPVLIY